jgi:hypothetical protein
MLETRDVSPALKAAHAAQAPATTKPLGPVASALALYSIRNDLHRGRPYLTQYYLVASRLHVNSSTRRGTNHPN